MDNTTVAHTVGDLMSRGQFVASNLERVISTEAQESAFGRPGEPGDVDLIEHMGSRLIGLYEQMLDWHAELRSLRVSDQAKRVIAAAHGTLSQPPQAVRDFAFTFVDQLEQNLRRRASGDTTPIVIAMELKLSVDDAVIKQLGVGCATSPRCDVQARWSVG